VAKVSVVAGGKRDDQRLLLELRARAVVGVRDRDLGRVRRALERFLDLELHPQIGDLRDVPGGLEPLVLEVRGMQDGHPAAALEQAVAHESPLLRSSGESQITRTRVPRSSRPASWPLFSRSSATRMLFWKNGAVE